MKKVLSLVLAMITAASVMAGCTTLEKDETGNYDKGAIIDMYLTTEVYDFDPQRSITDDAMLKIYSLIYEGLTTINENGKWEKALMKNYKVEKDADGEFSILITLNNTRWSDGRTVQAADLVYSWKRLLDPDATSEAASLLYDIKNARDVKTGDATVDDLESLQLTPTFFRLNSNRRSTSISSSKTAPPSRLYRSVKTLSRDTRMPTTRKSGLRSPLPS